MLRPDEHQAHQCSANVVRVGCGINNSRQHKAGPAKRLVDMVSISELSPNKYHEVATRLPGQYFGHLTSTNPPYTTQVVNTGRTQESFSQHGAHTEK